MRKVELLAPAGDFDCIKAAVQNGASAVYFGCSNFNARSSAKNFSIEEMENVIRYCILRKVKTYLTLNTLLKNEEFNDALLVAKKAYEFGIDGVIVQDLGLAKFLLDNFPELPVHASTQMTVHNLAGALELEKMGFKRIVLSRELSINEISYICRNTKVEIEVFVHGALCISYSGQCLFSSIVGGRSGNRGKCAQPCRLPYSLVEETPNNLKKIDSGYLLSTRDVCGLEFIPDLISAGVDCFKIEGRMKTPEYVATVTNVYRKYINLYYSNPDDENFKISKEDTTKLLQVFNRGGFSTGHLDNSENRNLIFKDKPNHIGLYLGTIYNYNKNKGIVTLSLNTNLSVGDTISFENEDSTYTVSELMDKNKKNISLGEKGMIVNFGRMKGKISIGDKVYKLSDKQLNAFAKKSFSGTENVITKLYCTITLKKNFPIVLNLHTEDDKYNVSVTSDVCPEAAIKSPISVERVVAQISKTGDFPFIFKDITVDMEEDLFIPKISVLNEIRRNALTELCDLIVAEKRRKLNLELPTLKQNSDVSSDSSIASSDDKNESAMVSSENKKECAVVSNRSASNKDDKEIPINLTETKKENLSTPNKKEISILLQNLNVDYDYSKLKSKNIKNIYIPFKYFLKKDYKDIILTLGTKGNLFIYMPTVIKANYKNLFFNNIDEILKNYMIKGFVLSNIGDFTLLKDYKKYKFIGNYTLNVFNDFSIYELKKLGLSKITISPELNKKNISDIIEHSNLPSELMVYGNLPIMNMGYCVLGKSNKCYPTCSAKCNNLKNRYYLIDRLNFKFRVIPDNLQTITSIYNSKITSFDFSEIQTPYLRLNFLDESIDDINAIIEKTLLGEKIQGKDFTNGNFNKEI